MGEYSNDELTFAMNILQYTLLSCPGAPLKQAILDAGLGKDVLSSYDSGLLQPTLMITVKEAPANKLEEFKQVIHNTLKELVEKGLDKKALKAAGFEHVPILTFNFSELHKVPEIGIKFSDLFKVLQAVFSLSS